MQVLTIEVDKMKEVTEQRAVNALTKATFVHEVTYSLTPRMATGTRRTCDVLQRDFGVAGWTQFMQASYRRIDRNRRIHLVRQRLSLAR